MDISQIEKVAGPIGENLASAAKLLTSATRFVGRHPYATLGAVGAIPAASFVFGATNRARGLHQIVTESSKSKKMNYQTELLREIAENSRQKASSAEGFKPLMPILPPLR